MTLEKPTTNQMATILLCAVAVLLGAGSLAGMEQQVFAPRVTTKSLLQKKQKLATDATHRAHQLHQRRVASQTDGTFVLAVQMDAPQPTNSVADTSDFDYIQCSGTMQLTDGSWRAILNSGSAAVGDTIRGCLIKHIEQKELLIEVNGKEIHLPKNEPYYYQPTETCSLRLDQITDRDGAWNAIFSGHPYRAGDWIDSHTQILGVTPVTVLVQRDQQRLTFSQANPTGKQRVSTQ